MSDERKGIRFTTPMRSVVAATTTTMLHQITPGRTAIIRKIIWNNRTAAGTALRIGSTDSAVGGIAGTYAQRIPEIDLQVGLGGSMTEEELPGYEFRTQVDVNTDIVMQANAAAAAPNDLQVQAEIEEFES